jgi:hypothetical protein
MELVNGIGWIEVGEAVGTCDRFKPIFRHVLVETLFKSLMRNATYSFKIDLTSEERIPREKTKKF